MTITLSVQEINAYQDEMEKWARLREDLWKTIAIDLAKRHHDDEALKRYSNADKILADAQHPFLGPKLVMPKLIPDV